MEGQLTCLVAFLLTLAFGSGTPEVEMVGTVDLVPVVVVVAVALVALAAAAVVVVALAVLAVLVAADVVVFDVPGAVEVGGVYKTTAVVVGAEASEASEASEVTEAAE